MNSSHTITIEQMSLEDFSFIRDVAAQQATFSIPPTFVLWMLLKAKPSLCFVAKDEANKRVGYLLALPVENPQHSIYVWQLAASASAASRSLLEHLYGVASNDGVEQVLFSAVPDSRELRAIRQHIGEITRSDINFRGLLPTVVSPSEAEYCVQLNSVRQT